MRIGVRLVPVIWIFDVVLPGQPFVPLNANSARQVITKVLQQPEFTGGIDPDLPSHHFPQSAFWQQIRKPCR